MDGLLDESVNSGFTDILNLEAAIDAIYSRYENQLQPFRD
jgi:hypothetical protein